MSSDTIMSERLTLTAVSRSCWLSPIDRSPFVRFELTTVACLLTCSLAFCFWTFAVTGRLRLMDLALFLCLSASIYCYGRSIARVLGMEMCFSLAFTTGSLVYALFVLCIKALCNMSLSWATFVVVGSSLILAVIPGKGRKPILVRPHRYEFFAICICLVAATLWSQDVLFSAVYQEGNEYVYKPWTDYFTHAKFTAMLLTETPLVQCDNYECSGQATMFYHYASYVFPASLAEFSKLPAYEALCAFWTPFGTTLVGLAAYGLATTWWGSRAGFGAILSLYCLPDASFYGFRNGFFGYWWLQQVGPAGNYGVACGAVALAVLFLGVERRDRVLIFAGLFFSFLSLLFKAHIFIHIFPLSCLVLVVCLPRLSLWTRLVAGLGVASFGLIASHLTSRFHLFPALGIDSGPSTEWFRKIIAHGNGSDWPKCLVNVFLQGQTTYQNPIRSLLILLGAAFGILPLVYCSTLAIAARRRMLEARCFLPAFATVLYCLFVFCLGRNEIWGGPAELYHRPFVWIYFLLAVFSGALLLRLPAPALLRLPFRGAVPACCCLLCIMPFYLGRGVQHAKHSFSDQYTDTRVSCGLHDCALFVRSRASATALLQVTDFDPYLVAGGLSEHPSFLARPNWWLSVSRSYRASSYQAKRCQVQKLVEADTAERLGDAVASTGIQWLIAQPGSLRSWPPALQDAHVYESGGFKVYNLHALLLGRVEGGMEESLNRP